MPVELPIVSFISALVVLIPLPWHWRTRKVCTTSAILWLAISNIIRVVNTIVWLNNVTVKYKIWCDIISRVELSANVAVPAATMCVCRRLAHASTPYHRALSPNEKRRRVKFEIGMCIVLPIILNALHVVVESCRFVISEGFGCTACHYPSIPALIITQVPTIIFSWTALIYSGVTLRWLIHRRVQFQQASKTRRLAPASSRYLRLVAMAVTQMTFASVMSLFLVTVSMHSGLYPWTSWEDVHQDWQEVFVEPYDPLAAWSQTLFTVGWYFVPIASVTTFGYFGFDERVIAEYKGAFAWAKLNVLRIKGKVAVPRPSAGDAMPGQARSSADIVVIDMDGRHGVRAPDSLGLEEVPPRDRPGEP